MTTKKGKKTKMPVKVSPMLCTLTKEVPEGDEYLFEIKWDGYRIIAFVGKKEIILQSRSGLNYSARYPLIANELSRLKHQVVLDGEVVVFNEKGLPDFDALQVYNANDQPISYCIFDILWLDGYDVQLLSLEERRNLLSSLIHKSEVLRMSEFFEDGQALYQEMRDMNLEGVVAKKKGSPYHQGERAGDWLKTPTKKRQEFVIGGWAESGNGRSFKSLLFGAYKNGKLEWIGRSGGGYKLKEMPGILSMLQKLETEHSPFANEVLDTKNAPIHWVKPKLVANFEFATWTKSGRIRKPATFLGFRKDKKPSDVVREIPSPRLLENEKANVKKKRARRKSTG